MTEENLSLWRQKANYYFGPHPEHYNNSINSRLTVPHKISPDSTLPLSFYVDNKGMCSIFSLDGEYRFKDLGNAQLSGNAKTITSIANVRDNLLVASERGVTMYSTNASSTAKAQNIDDFMQMALPGQEQPKDLGSPVAQFFCCDTKVPSWPHSEYSVLPKEDFQKEYKIAQKEVTKFYTECKKNTPFRITESFVFDHKAEMQKLDSSHPPPPPLSGANSNVVRQLTYTYKNPSTFESICGPNWFSWDIQRQKLKTSGYGGGFQLFSIDVSPILRDTFAVGTAEGNVNIIDLRAKDGIQIVHATNALSPITKVKFSPIIQPLLATTSNDYAVKLWDLRSGFDKPFLVLNGHTHEISSIQFSNHRPDFLFTSSYDSTVRVWNINGQYPPHHCLEKIVPSPGAKVLEMSAGFHRADCFYYSCSDGKTGVVELRPNMFKPVIPHRLTTPEDQEAEELLYFKRNQLLLAKILPKVNEVFEKKEDVTPIFPLLDLTKSVPFDLTTSKLNNASIEEVISYYSYYNSTAVPLQLIQNPEPHQTTDALRTMLFAKVIGGIQKKDSETLIREKRNIITVLDAFSREQVLGIVQVIAMSSFEEALEVGFTYLELVSSTGKTDKFLDVGYFLLYPTVYDDPSDKFIPYTEKGVDEKTRLKPIFDNTNKIKTELKDLQVIIVTAANDLKTTYQEMFKILHSYDSFVSLFLFRTYLTLALSLQQWSSCIVKASSIANELSSYKIKDVLFNWIENEFSPRFFPTVAKKIADEKVTDVCYATTVAEIIVVGIGTEKLTDNFETKIKRLLSVVKNSIDKVIGNHESVKIFQKPSYEIASMIQKKIDELKHFSSQKNNERSNEAQKLKTIISAAASKA